jgi:hypothetical protein
MLNYARVFPSLCACQQVEKMSVELEKKKIVVAQAQKDCEELLVEVRSCIDHHAQASSSQPPHTRTFK